jgi:hypothetical protein
MLTIRLNKNVVTIGRWREEYIGEVSRSYSVIGCLCRSDSPSEQKNRIREYVNHSSLFFLLSRTVKDQQEMHASSRLLDGVIIGRENAGRYI